MSVNVSPACASMRCQIVSASVMRGLASGASLLPHVAAPIQTEKFGDCTGGPNCVIDGETIRVGGDTLKIAGMRAPRIRSARCDAEEQRGVKAVEELTALLNSGKVTTGDQVREPDGQTRTEVLVNGQDVAAAMIAASAAREAGSIPPSWC